MHPPIENALSLFSRAGRRRLEAPSSPHPEGTAVGPDSSGTGCKQNVGEVAGLLASGSRYSRAFPHGRPVPRESSSDDSWRRIEASVQWLPGFVPGYSGGGRAGFSPASLSTRARLTDRAQGVTTTPELSKKRYSAKEKTAEGILPICGQKDTGGYVYWSGPPEPCPPPPPSAGSGVGAGGMITLV